MKVRKAKKILKEMKNYEGETYFKKLSWSHKKKYFIGINCYGQTSLILI